MEPTKEAIEKLIKKFEDYAQEKGFRMNPDRKRVENVARVLLKKEATQGAQYCPCRVVTGDQKRDEKIACPCVYHEDEVKDKGHCLCWLFVK
ncbi:ferredoxin:thioredoxin reductase [Candidatus Dependentiae bacterium]|nr:ferredoxin:thioredoxin reductase [Candidatus Dependentiae bacterium]